MKTEFYHNFITVADCHSINAASKELLIAQPALSTQIHNIENELGVLLFERRARSVELTEAGRTFYKYASDMLQMEHNMMTEMEAYRKGDFGILRLGVTRSAPDPMLIRLLNAYTKAYPNVHFSIIERSSGDLVEDLQNHLIEIALVRVAHELPPTINQIMTFSEHFHALCAENSTKLPSDTDMISLSALADIPLSVPKGHFEYIKNSFSKYGYRFNLQSLSSSRSMLTEWVRMDAAVGLLSMPDDSYEPLQGIRDYKIIGAPLASKRQFITMANQSLSKPAKRFIDTIYSVFAPN